MSKSTSKPLFIRAATALVAACLTTPLFVASSHASTIDSSTNPAVAPGTFNEQNLAADRTSNNWFYRIPALTHLGNGVVLAAWDARPGSAADSPNPNTIVQRRSTDNGKTWGPLTTIAAGHVANASKAQYGYSDPSYVFDSETGKVFVFFVYSKDQGFFGGKWGNDDTNRQVVSAAVVESSDQGITWSAPKLITNVVKPGPTSTPQTGDVRAMFATSGAGIQLTRGDHAGRLIQQYVGDVKQADGTTAFQAYSVYSDDHGATWKRGNYTGTKMDENKVVELSDGRVMLNSRDNAGGGYRKVATSTDGGQTYGTVTQDFNLPDPTNNAHITQLFPNAAAGTRNAKKLLYTGANSQSGRQNVSARVSCDDGKTWPGLRTIRQGTSAYSVATALDNGSFGVYYEAGYTNTMPFATFDEQWLNYTCAPLSANDFAADANSTKTIAVTITNQEESTLSGTLSLAATAGFAATPVVIDALAAGASQTVNLSIKIPATANGKYLLQPVFTASSGKASQGLLRATISGTEVTGVKVTGARTDTQRNLATNPYAVGEKVPYAFTVQNNGNINQWVVPTEGNFTPLIGQPVGQSSPAGNCRYSNLAPNASYTCDTPRHEVTTADLADGFFTPTSKWTSGRLSSYTSVVNSYPINGGEVDLKIRTPKLEATIGQPKLQDTNGDGKPSVGERVNYEVTLANAGTVRLTNVEGGGLKSATLAQGETLKHTAFYTLKSEQISSGALSPSAVSFTGRNGTKTTTTSVQPATFHMQ